jgi:heme-degrading monooxygenase HmoA
LFGVLQPGGVEIPGKSSATFSPAAGSNGYPRDIRRWGRNFLIARIWHGRTPLQKSDEYLQFLIERALPDYRGTAGNRTAKIFRRHEKDAAHFITFTIWESLDSIRAFAGEEIEKAKYYPEDSAFLLEFEPTVQHYEVYE